MSKLNIKQIRGNVVTQTGHGFSVGEPIYQGGGSYALARADIAATAAEFVVLEVIDANTFVLALPQQDVSVTMSALMETGHPALSFPADNGKSLFVSETEDGKYTTTAPTIRNIVGTLQDTNTMRSLGTAEALLAAPAGGVGGGEANTASNVGTAGVGILKAKVGVDLQLKNLNTTANAGISLVDDTGNDEIDINLDINGLGVLVNPDAAIDTIAVYDGSTTGNRKATWNELDTLRAPRTISASTTLLATDDLVLIDSSAGAIVITVDPAIMKRKFKIKCIDVTNTITVTASSGTIYGTSVTPAASYIIDTATGTFLSAPEFHSDLTNLYLT